MTMVAFTGYTNDIAPHVDGCPTGVIVVYLRKVFTDLCDRTLCWRTTLANLAVVAGTSTYALTSPISDTEVGVPLKAKLVRASDSANVQDVAILTYEQALQRYPDWPNTSNTGVPQVVFQMTPGTLCVAPVPDALDTYTLKLTTSLRPTTSATTVESGLMGLYKRAIFHGVVHELMMLPKRIWSDTKLAEFHGKQWEFFLNTAKAKVNKGFTRANLSAVMRPWA